MPKILVWILNNKKLILISIILLFLLPIGIVIYLHGVLSDSFFSYIGITSDSLVTYIFGFLGFIASITLSAIAIINSEAAVKIVKEGNDISDRILSIEERQDKIERVPYTYLKKVCFSGVVSYPDMPTLVSNFVDCTDPSYKNISCLCFNISILNVSKICSYIHFLEFNIREKSTKIYLGTRSLSFMEPILLSPSETYNFIVLFPNPLFRMDVTLECFITLDSTNHIKEVYRQFLFFKIPADEGVGIKTFLDSHHVTPMEDYEQNKA